MKLTARKPLIVMPDEFDAALDRYIEQGRLSRERFLATATPDMIETYERELKRLNSEAARPSSNNFPPPCLSPRFPHRSSRA